MDGDQDLVSLAVDPDGVVEVLVFIVWGEVDVDVFTDAGWDHAFLIVLNLKVGCLWWQDVKPLWGWRVVDQFHFQNVGLSKFKASELSNRGICAEKAVSTNRVEFVVEAEMVLLLC